MDSDKQTTQRSRFSWRNMMRRIRLKEKRSHKPLVLMLARKWIRRI